MNFKFLVTKSLQIQFILIHFEVFKPIVSFICLNLLLYNMENGIPHNAHLITLLRTTLCSPVKSLHRLSYADVVQHYSLKDMTTQTIMSKPNSLYEFIQLKSTMNKRFISKLFLPTVEL